MADKSLDPNFNKYGELTSFDPTWRMQTRDVVANYLQDLGLASTRQAALDMAEGFTGSPDPTADIADSIGVLDFTPLGLAFGAQEIKRGFETAQNPADYAILGLSGALTAAEAIPLAKSVTTPTKKFLQGLSTKISESDVGPLMGERFEDAMSSMGALNRMGPKGKKPPAQARPDELGFYSAVEESVLNLKRKKGSGDAFINDIMKYPNVTKDEMNWMGLTGFLKGKKSVTAEDIQKYVDANKVQISERQFGGPIPMEKVQPTMDSMGLGDMPATRDVVENTLRQLEAGYIDPADLLYELDLQINVEDAALEEMLNAAKSSEFYKEAILEGYGTESQYKDALINDLYEAITENVLNQWDARPAAYIPYSTKGGSNYRDVVFSVPSKKTYSKELDYPGASHPPGLYGPSFVGGHYGGRNDIAHMRISDHIANTGEKVLLIGEIQSDWIQRGKKKGYYKTDSEKNAKADNIKKLIYSLERAVKKLRESYSPVDISNLSYPGQVELLEGFPAAIKEEIVDHRQKIRDLRIELRDLDEMVPDAPLQDNWYKLALKRALRIAAEGDYDRIAIAPAKEQAQRYPMYNPENPLKSMLSVPEMHYTKATKSKRERLNLRPDKPDQDVWIVTAFPDQEMMRDENFNFLLTDDELPQMFEKDVVKMMKDGEGLDATYQLDPDVDLGDTSLIEGMTITDAAKADVDSWDRLNKEFPKQKFIGKQELANLDRTGQIMIGGQNMKKYYDRLYPNALRDLAKKVDKKVESDPVYLQGDFYDPDAADTMPHLYHSIQVTPKMRDELLRETTYSERGRGQPTFGIAGGAGLGALSSLGEGENENLNVLP